MAAVELAYLPSEIRMKVHEARGPGVVSRLARLWLRAAIEERLIDPRAIPGDCLPDATVEDRRRREERLRRDNKAAKVRARRELEREPSPC